jgi:DNA-binding transcriptional LysR family regulator
MLEAEHIFITVVEQQGFSKAAKKLKLSTSVVTRRIAQLEKKLGARLLQRTTRHVITTEAGLVFYQSCHEIMQNYDALIKKIKHSSEEVSGTLKVGIPASLNHLHVTNELHRFIKKYPQLNIHLVNGNHLIDLLSNGFDLIIHCGELRDSSLYCKKIGSWTKITCASAYYLKKHRRI